MKKAEAEKLFVKELLQAGGVELCYRMCEYGNWYYCFDLKDGTRRYWTNMSKENLSKLGVKEV